MSANGNGAKKNPFVKRVAELAAAAAGLNRLRERAQDEWWLAVMKVRELERQIGTFSTTERGVALPAGFQRKYERAQQLAQQTEGEYRQVEEPAQKGNAKLHTAQRDAQEWERRAAYWANQAEQRSQETPRQRAIREARELLRQEGLSR